MKSINVTDIHEMNDIIVELPAFADLKSKDSISKVLDIFMERLYLEQPQELIDAFHFKLSENMQSTFYRNYGIDDDYDAKIMGYVKGDLAYSLEKLFQNKGARKTFELLAVVLESIFNKINFYSVEVQKEKRVNENGYAYKYMLAPIYIQDESVVLTEPDMPIEKSRKYLMDLQSYDEYTVWPVPTNYVYIQFSVGTSLINNTNTFISGVRSYGATYLSGQYFNYLSNSGVVETLEASDMELLVNYINMNLIKENNPDWDGLKPFLNGAELNVFQEDEFLKLDSESADEYRIRSRDLQEKRCSTMHSIALLFKDYSEADYANRDHMENLRRRWQLFLAGQYSTDECYTTIDELNEKIKLRYPRFSEDFMATLGLSAVGEKENLFDFIIKIYSVFLNGTTSSFSQAKNVKCFPPEIIRREIVSYSCKDKKGNVLSREPSFEYTPVTNGVETLTTTVENIDGFVDSDTVTITVEENGPVSPKVWVSRDRIVRVDSTVTVRGEVSTLSGEVIKGYEWSLDGKIIKDYYGDRPSFIETEVKRVYVNLEVPEIRDYKLVLKVWDSTGAVNYNSTVVRSIKDETPQELYPQANAGPNLRAATGVPITIDTSGEDLEIIEVHDQDWIIAYVDTVFGNLFLNGDFLKYFVSPIMDLFEKYFFPVELEYVTDLVNKEKVRDKWNSVSTKSKAGTQVQARQSDIQTPMRGLDQAYIYVKMSHKYSRPITYDLLSTFEYDGNVGTRIYPPKP